MFRLRDVPRFWGRIFHDRPDTFWPFVLGSMDIFTISPSMVCVGSTTRTGIVDCSLGIADVVGGVLIVVDVVVVVVVVVVFVAVMMVYEIVV